MNHIHSTVLNLFDVTRTAMTKAFIARSQDEEKSQNKYPA